MDVPVAMATERPALLPNIELLSASMLCQLNNNEHIKLYHQRHKYTIYFLSFSGARSHFCLMVGLNPVLWFANKLHLFTVHWGRGGSGGRWMHKFIQPSSKLSSARVVFTVNNHCQAPSGLSWCAVMLRHVFTHNNNNNDSNSSSTQAACQTH